MIFLVIYLLLSFLNDFSKRIMSETIEPSASELFYSIFCCFRICKRTAFSEHGLGVYMASPSEVRLFFILVLLIIN